MVNNYWPTEFYSRMMSGRVKEGSGQQLSNRWAKMIFHEITPLSTDMGDRNECKNWFPIPSDCIKRDVTCLLCIMYPVLLITRYAIQ